LPSEVLRGHVGLLVLATLRDGPLHGYGIVERLRGASKGAFNLAEGTVYPALYRLEASGLLASKWTSLDGRRRRVYRLTRRGRAELARERKEWKAFARAIEAVVT
jgi:PadR family transcriptional regulator, regulatory protein PadR